MAINQQTLALQKQLLAAGFNPGPLDGVMGPKTKAALAQFNTQKAAAPQPQRAVAAPTPTPEGVSPAPIAPAAPPVDNVNTLYQDPAFLAFQRASGQGLEIAAADVARKQQAYQTALQAGSQSLQQNREQGLKSADNSAEARGVFRGGQRLANRQVQEDQYTNQLGQLQTNTATNIADLNASMTNRVAEQQQKAAELGFGTAQQQALTNDYDALKKKYPGQF
jgi:hypothetical protein